jgi:hypothetical protein
MDFERQDGEGGRDRRGLPGTEREVDGEPEEDPAQAGEAEPGPPEAGRRFGTGQGRGAGPGGAERPVSVASGRAGRADAGSVARS